MSEKIRQAIIDLAERELGTTEYPAGSNKVKYNDWYYPEGHKYFQDSTDYAWCGTFCSYVYLGAGFQMPPIDTELGVHYIPTLYHKAKALKWNTDEPQMGDLVLFDFKNDGKTFAQHIGIFHSWLEKGKTFTTIEGNTSKGESGSQNNGDGVYKRKRNITTVCLFVNIIDNVQ
jgi:hypothetical protein